MEVSLHTVLINQNVIDAPFGHSTYCNNILYSLKERQI